VCRVCHVSRAMFRCVYACVVCVLCVCVFVRGGSFCVNVLVLCVCVFVCVCQHTGLACLLFSLTSLLVSLLPPSLYLPLSISLSPPFSCSPSASPCCAYPHTSPVIHTSGEMLSFQLVDAIRCVYDPIHCPLSAELIRLVKCYHFNHLWRMHGPL